jgi:hypothetical protein
MTEEKLVRFYSTKTFDKKWQKRVGASERQAFEKARAENPTVGDVIAGTGGARKVRWARPGKGKSGGVRVIYYYQAADDAIWLMGVYAKNEKTDLSDRDTRALAEMIKVIKE